MEATVKSTVLVLGSRPQWVESFEESLLSDLEKDLYPSGVEWNIGRLGNGRTDPDRESLDDQQWVHIKNDPDFICETSKVLAEAVLLLLPHPEQGCDSWLWSSIGEKVPPEVGCVVGGISSLGLTGVELSCDIGGPPSSTKCCGCSTAFRKSTQRDSGREYKRDPT
ncbi:hypothetical protein BHM03_00055965 [Ensete ventricosum]|nr:hypothetical protein BHM03_00055965 [Ensete ventricosum]